MESEQAAWHSEVSVAGGEAKQEGLEVSVHAADETDRQPDGWAEVSQQADKVVSVVQTETLLAQRKPHGTKLRTRVMT